MSTKTDTDILAKWLNDAIEAAGTNQSQLARALGLSSQQVNRMVQGTRNMTAADLIRISAFLKTPPPELENAKIYIDGFVPTRNVDDFAQADSQAEFDEKAYNRAFEAAVELERTLYGGSMPLTEFIKALTIGLKAQKHGQK